jgi:hypothetical protein
MRPIHNPGLFAIRSDLFLVVAAAVVGDLEDFVSEVFRLTLARQSIQLAKFLIAGEPAEYRGSGRHRGIGADGPQAFTVDEPVTDRFGDLGEIARRAGVLGLVLVVMVAINDPGQPELSLRWRCARAIRPCPT